MATHVEVLLRENVAPLGKCGDVVRVRPGYARNYLLPNKLAIDATPENKRFTARKRARLDVEEAERDARIDERVVQLSGVAVTTKMKADDGGRLFGSVSAATIAELLVRAGNSVEERDVRLDSPIKTIGAHRVRVHVFGDKFAEITLDVAAE